MLSHDWNTTLRKTRQMSILTPRCEYLQPSQALIHIDGRHFQNNGGATMNATPQQTQPTSNRSEEEEIYPLTTVEIAEAQRADATYKHLFKRNAVIDQGLEIKLIENTL